MNGQVTRDDASPPQGGGLDAYVAYTPSNVFFYATGFQSHPLMQWWRMQGTVLAVIPADEPVEPGLMIGDFEARAVEMERFPHGPGPHHEERLPPLPARPLRPPLRHRHLPQGAVLRLRGRPNLYRRGHGARHRDAALHD